MIFAVVEDVLLSLFALVTVGLVLLLVVGVFYTSRSGRFDGSPEGVARPSGAQPEDEIC